MKRGFLPSSATGRSVLVVVVALLLLGVSFTSLFSTARYLDLSASRTKLTDSQHDHCQNHGFAKTKDPGYWADTLLPSPGTESSNTQSLDELTEAFKVMRWTFFLRDVGTWPEASDWTAAVAQTIHAGVFKTLASKPSLASENTMNALFVELLSSFFGQNSLFIRSEAYDDMLWVVLGWLEALDAVWTYSDRLQADSHDNALRWYGNEVRITGTTYPGPR